jgi:hypothetical protein
MGGPTCTIVSYNLQWDKGLGGSTWENLVGVTNQYTSLNFLQTSGISSTKSYRFRVRAKNKYNWGAFSPILTVKAAVVPGAPATITTV